jgi:hypothetical protein
MMPLKQGKSKYTLSDKEKISELLKGGMSLVVLEEK